MLCWAWLTGCAAAQHPIGPARVTVLEEGRDYQGFSTAPQKCQQRTLPPPSQPRRRVAYGKRRWIIL